MSTLNFQRFAIAVDKSNCNVIFGTVFEFFHEKT